MSDSILVETPSAVVSKAVQGVVTITRPANVTQYAAGDVISDSATSFKFSNFTRVQGGSALITDLKVISDNSPATALTGEVWLFSEDITRDADNAAFTPSDAEMLTLQAVIPFGSTSNVGTASGNIVYSVKNIQERIKAEDDSHDIYVVVKATNTYTPASGEVLTIKLNAVLD